MRMQLHIGNKIIGEGRPCFIIGEAGVNHNGSLKLAQKLVDVAKRAGVDAVKFQTFKSEHLVTAQGEMAEYQKKNIGKTESQLAMLKKLELDYEDFRKLKRYCDKKKIMFLSTPHTDDAVDFLNSLVPVFKIGSGDLTNIPLLEKIAKRRKPMIVSTGMATLKEVKDAVHAIRKAGNRKIILLHCTTNYPCPFQEVNLKAMVTLEKKFGLPTGYSDHTAGIVVPVMAVTLGAKVIEKHFTLDKDLPGPDHKASLEPHELKEMVGMVRDAEKALGNGVKKPTASEERIKKVARKSIIAKVDMVSGTKISPRMLIVKRPGTGIQPKAMRQVIGKKAKRIIRKDTVLSWADLQ